MNKNKNFASDVLSLMSVPVISQVLGLLLMPIITRMYTPDTFGVSNMLGSITMLFAGFATMGYHRGIILPKNNSAALGLIILCFSFTIIVTSLAILIVWILKDFIIAQTNTPYLKNFLWLTPFFVFFHGTYQILRFWNIRLKQFGAIAISRVTDTISKKSFQLIAGILGYATAGSLIIADLFAVTAKTLVLLRSLGSQLFFLFNIKYLLIKTFALAKRYKKFPKYYLWSEWLIRIPMFFTSFIIIKYFGPDKLGYYSLGLLVLSLPSLLIGGAISEAFIPRVAMAKHVGKHVDLLDKVFSRLLALLIFPFMILGFFGDKLFSFIFSSTWVEAGIIAQILAVRVFLDALFSPTFFLTNILEKQELEFIRNLINTVIIVGSMLLGVYFTNIFLALWVMTLLDSVLIITLGIYIMRIINFPFSGMFHRSFKYCGICLLLGLIIVFIDTSMISNTTILLITIGSTTVFYYAILLYTDRELFNNLMQVLYSLKR